MKDIPDPIKLQQRLRWLPADTETPISLQLSRMGSKEGILLESAEVDGRWGRYSILATDICFYAVCKDGKLDLEIRNEKFSSLNICSGSPFLDGMRKLLASLQILPDEKAKNLPPITRAFYGYMGFGMASVFNPHLKKAMPLNEAECRLAFPASVLVFDHLYNRLCELSLEGEWNAEKMSERIDSDFAVSPDSLKMEPGEAGYKKFVEIIRDRLRHGEAIQVVPSTRFSVKYSGNPFMLYRKMRRYNASPYMFYMKFPDLTLFGSSPEVMVSCSRNTLHLSPIAGTRQRGATDAVDAANARELMEDPKEQAEHVMLVDLGRNDLGRIARPGTVKVEKYMEVERFSHVMHLTSSISASLLEKAGDRLMDAFDVLTATFPAGTVSGAPKFRAMEIIRGLEGSSRGPYGGCIGWISLDRDSVNMDMGITIRSMWTKDGRLYWQAGGGIVHDSNPEQEWKEVINKSAIMRLVFQQEDEDYVPSHR